VRVFSLEGDDGLGTDTWKQIGQDIIGEANGNQFGSSVSISKVGKTIAVGAKNNDANNVNGVYSVGHIRIYRLEDNGMSWEQIGYQDIDGEATYDELGHSVSLSANGSTIAIGTLSIMQASMSKSVVPTMMAETGCRLVRPFPAMPLKIILVIL